MRSKFAIARVLKNLRNDTDTSWMLFAWLAQQLLDPLQMEAFTNITGSVNIEPIQELDNDETNLEAGPGNGEAVRG